MLSSGVCRDFFYLVVLRVITSLLHWGLVKMFSETNSEDTEYDTTNSTEGLVVTCVYSVSPMLLLEPGMADCCCSLLNTFESHEDP